jgi:hypothetical protein
LLDLVCHEASRQTRPTAPSRSGSPTR